MSTFAHTRTENTALEHHQTWKPEMHAIDQILNKLPGIVPYRPWLNKITGNPLSSIFLQQIIYWWLKVERRPFYKFQAPCNHRRYKEGDSWQEELGFSRSQLDAALKPIATKIKQGQSKKKALSNSIILYWTDGDRVTWWQLNEPVLLEILDVISPNAEFCNSLNIILPNAESCNSQVMQDSALPENAESCNSQVVQNPTLYESETTTKNTPEISSSSCDNVTLNSVTLDRESHSKEEEKKKVTLNGVNTCKAEIFSLNENGYVYEPVDIEGIPLPRGLKVREHPVFLEIRPYLLGNLTEMPSQELEGFYWRIIVPSENVDGFREWCVWQAMNNAKDKPWKIFQAFVFQGMTLNKKTNTYTTTYDCDFERWKRGEFKKKTEIEAEIARARRGEKPKPGMTPEAQAMMDRLEEFGKDWEAMANG